MKISELPKEVKEKAEAYRANEADASFEKDTDILHDAFDWDGTKEGFVYWRDYCVESLPSTIEVTAEVVGKELTAMQELKAILEDAQKHIIAKGEYADGYNGAIDDVLLNIEKYLPKEKKQIIDAFWGGKEASMLYDGEQYYSQMFNQLNK